MKIDIPNKLYFKIGEVAKMADVPTHVLRYWESEFKTIKPKRTSSKQRMYRRKDVELILNIKDLLHTKGYTIAGAKRLINTGKVNSNATNDMTENKITNKTAHKLSVIKQELMEIKKFLE